MAARDYKFEYMLLNRLQCDCNYYLGHGGNFNPTVVEKFDNKTDADSYAALICRAKQRRYIVLEQVTEWGGTPQKNA